MERKKVMILFGGCSSEYEVSLQSACSVMKYLDPDQYEGIYIGITKEGKWLRYYDKIDFVRDNTWHLRPGCKSAMLSLDRGSGELLEFSGDTVLRTKIDVAFPVLHGKNGEDGTLQGVFELAGIPYVGCGVLSSALCMEKHYSHVLAKEAGVSVPDCVLLVKDHISSSALRKAEGMGYPLFVKPVRGGSSIGMTKAQDFAQLLQGIQEAFLHDDRVMIEEAIEGFEVGCAVLGNEEAVIGEVDEIELQEGFFDYHEKYHLETSKIVLPARIEPSLKHQVQAAALRLYQLFQCSGLARIDFFVTPDHEIVFNEINTLPGFTENSRYPNMLKQIDIIFPDLVCRLIDLAIKRHQRQNADAGLADDVFASSAELTNERIG